VKKRRNQSPDFINANPLSNGIGPVNRSEFDDHDYEYI